MTDFTVHPIALFLLRQALFLGPLFLTVVLMLQRKPEPRLHLAALFSLFYALPLVFAGHVAAIALGVWSYQGDALKILSFPADIWLGGSLLWGPALFLAFPRLNPSIPTAAVICLNGVLMPSLDPFMQLGSGWFYAVIIIFAVAHLPALFLARWTMKDVHLPLRASLLALAYGVFAFFALPSLVMHAMGGTWQPLAERSFPILVLSIAGLGVCFVVGLTAVQMFAVHGGGTPIPLDPTKRLVRTGIYAYLRNPMQTCTALAWIIMGLVLWNLWVGLSAVMAVLFVLGLVRWHHRQDLEARFPAGWGEYRDSVPEWFPRWKPWVRCDAELIVDLRIPAHRWMASGLLRMRPVGLKVTLADRGSQYRSPDEASSYRGFFSIIKGLEHINLLWALFAASVLLVGLPLRFALRRSARSVVTSSG